MIRQSMTFLLSFTLLTGVVYPLVVTGLAQALFPSQANGSLREEGGKTRGSTLVGQPFDDNKYFWGRPSATAPFAYNAGASTGSNQGPSNPALHEAIEGRIKTIQAAHPSERGPIPIDLVTASGSGLDPHISVEAARYQVARVAKARSLSAQEVTVLVEAHTEGRTLGFLGEPRVNVLTLNLALDEKSPL